MNKTSLAKQKKTANVLSPTQSMFQRKCVCGNKTVASGECMECAKKNSVLQRKLAIGESNDPLEREADRVADQVMAIPKSSTVSHSPPRIQRYAGRATEGPGTTPSSVDRVLASSGRPLEPVLRQDMEQRFGHDFSQVRVHSGGAAEQSAREVNANAYTAGHNVVFGVGQFAPETNVGQQLLAHELTHVVQQQSMPTTTTTVMRRGRTVGGFFANIFQWWDYSQESLNAYLKILDRTNDIQGDDDSDDMARQVASESKADKSRYKLTPKLRVLLIREMLDGAVFGSDQEGILTLLKESSDADLREMFGPAKTQITYPEIQVEFGDKKESLEAFAAKHKLTGPGKNKSESKSKPEESEAGYELDAMDKAVIPKLREAMEASKENKRENCGNVFETSDKNYRLTGLYIGEEPVHGKPPECRAEGDSLQPGEMWVAYYHSHIPTPNFVPYLGRTDPDLVFSFDDKISAQNRNIVYYLVNWKKEAFRYTPNPNLPKGEYGPFRKIHDF